MQRIIALVVFVWFFVCTASASATQAACPFIHKVKDGDSFSRLGKKLWTGVSLSLEEQGKIIARANGVTKAPYWIIKSKFPTVVIPCAPQNASSPQAEDAPVQVVNSQAFMLPRKDLALLFLNTQDMSLAAIPALANAAPVNTAFAALDSLLDHPSIEDATPRLAAIPKDYYVTFLIPDAERVAPGEVRPTLIMRTTKHKVRWKTCSLSATVFERDGRLYGASKLPGGMLPPDDFAVRFDEGIGR